MNVFSRSWRLTQQCMHVLSLDRELMVYPILSGIAMFFVTLSFLLPVFFVNGFDDHMVSPMALLLYFAYYLVSYFVITYFQSALVATADIRINGGDPTVKDGFRAANLRLGNIFVWSLIAATVGVVLRALQSKSGTIGRVVVGLAGFAWSLMTFFVAPMLVIENRPAPDAIRQSAKLFKKTWGERAVFRFSLSFLFFVLCLFAVPFLVLALMSGQSFIFLFVLGISIVYWIILALVGSALSGIFVAVMYNFAKNGKVASMFSEEIISSAIIHR